MSWVTAKFSTFEFVNDCSNKKDGMSWNQNERKEGKRGILLFLSASRCSEHRERQREGNTIVVVSLFSICVDFWIRGPFLHFRSGM